MPNPAKQLLQKWFKKPSSATTSRNPQPQEPPPPPSPSPPPSPQKANLRIPAAFICPVSSLVMFAPVLTDSGHSIEQACFQECRNLNFTPPGLDPPPTFSSKGIIYNVNLSSACREWCRTYGHPQPVPIQPEQARHIVKGLKSMTDLPAPPLPLPYSFDPEQEESISNSIKSSNPSIQEYGLKSLTILDPPFCSPRILAAVISLLTSAEPVLHIQSNYLIFFLSCEPTNGAHIFRAGAVPHLINVLNSGLHGSCAAAAGTLGNLARDDPYCRLTIGAMGGIEALLDRFSRNFLALNERQRAGWALHGLSLYCQVNVEVLAEKGGVSKLMKMVTDEMLPREELNEPPTPSELKKQALEILNCLVGVERGREEVMRRGNIRKLLMLVRVGEGVGLQSLNVMYNLCRENSERFGVFASAAGGEVVLAEETENWGQNGKEMASAMLRVIRGELKEGEELKFIDISSSNY